MPFYVSSDRTVVNAIKHALWSPNRDLIACLTHDCQLHAFREFPSFQRIWALSFQSEPTAICWQPDGVRLAVGHSDGNVSIIDAENGDTLVQTRAQEQPIACLAWSSTRLRDKEGSQLVHDMRNRYLRVCPRVPKDAADNDAPAAATDSKAPQLVERDFEVLDILGSADTAGNVSLSAFGHYPILSFSLAKTLKTPIGQRAGPAPKSEPQQLALCPALSRLFITYGTSADTSRGGTLGLAVCSLHSLSSQLSELHGALLVAAALRNLMLDCKAAAARLFRTLASARSVFVKLFALYSDGESIAEPARKWDATRDVLRHSLLAVLVRGIVSPAMEAFLGNSPGEHGLKQAARAIDGAFTSAHAELAGPLADVLQRAVFLLDELLGLLASDSAYSRLGVQAEEARGAKAAASSLLVRLEATQRMVTDTACLHRAFFRRLLAFARARGDGEAGDAAAHDQRAVEAFMRHHFTDDALSQELLTGTQANPSRFNPDRAPLAPRSTDSVLRLMHLSLGQQPPQALPLKAALAQLEAHVAGVFAALPSVLSPSVQPLTKIAISGRGKGHPPCATPLLYMLPPPEAGAGAGPQPAAPLEMQFMFTCAAASAARRDAVALLRLRYDALADRFEDVRGCLLDVCADDPSTAVVDAHCFKDGAIVVLTRVDAGGDAAGPSDAQTEVSHGFLSLVPNPFVEDSMAVLESSVQQECVTALTKAGAVVRLDSVEGVKTRRTPSGMVNTPLVVSVSRALAAVCAMQRITVYDLDEDEEDEEGASGEEEGEDGPSDAGTAGEQAGADAEMLSD